MEWILNLIFEFNDDLTLFGMFPGLKISHPIWSRQKVEVDSTPSVPWNNWNILTIYIRKKNFKLFLGIFIYYKMIASLPFYTSSWHWISTRNFKNLGSCIMESMTKLMRKVFPIHSAKLKCAHDTIKSCNIFSCAKSNLWHYHFISER